MLELKKPLRLISLVVLLLFLAACTSAHKTPRDTSPPADPDSLAGLQKLSGKKRSKKRPRKKQLTSIRRTAIQETAMSIGAQSGLAKRAKAINSTLTSQDKNLDRVFNFRGIVLDNNVLPPILEEGRNTLNLDDPTSIRIADRSYQIIQQARFVTAPPHWRDYLWLNYQNPEKPNKALLPKTKEEKQIWREYIAKGWQQGIDQANTIFSDNLARLKRDYKGMVLYRTLLAQNMVTKPYVAQAGLGVTGDGSSMRVNDQILRITALPSLNTNSKTWKPALDADKEASNKTSALDANNDAANNMTWHK